MSCSRCGQSAHTPRPAPIPSVVGRPGAGSVSPSRIVPVPPMGNGIPSNVIRSAIAGLRYVPTK